MRAKSRRRAAYHGTPTEYAGTTFRSQLEAAWARRFDRHRRDWVYEAVRAAAMTVVVGGLCGGRFAVVFVVEPCTDLAHRAFHPTVAFVEVQEKTGEQRDMQAVVKAFKALK